MYPHDYHDPHDHHPHMHNRGEGRPYIDPNVDSFKHDAALPVLSSIGRGPKGRGIYSVWDPETCVLKIYDDENDELKCSVVLDSPKVTISQPHDVYPGQNAELDITVEQGDITTVYPVMLPCGEPGSHIFTYNNSVGYYEEHTTSESPYRTLIWVSVDSIAEDIVYDDYTYSSPAPRVNDKVFINNELTTIIAVDDHAYNIADPGDEPVYSEAVPSVLLLLPVGLQ